MSHTKTIMLVDDSRVFLRIVEEQIKTVMNVVGIAHDGNVAFEMYKNLKPHFVLLDITMPNCSGKECLSMILKFDPDANVVMTSSVGDDITIQECLSLGARAFIKKEIVSARHTSENSAILSTLKEILSKHPVREAA